jgi:outer membrane protein assembly factor BamB
MSFCHRLSPCLFATLALFATGANWPQFRGPDAAATSADTGLPVTWSDEKNIAWKIQLPGYGASSPITWGDKIYLTLYSGYGAGNKDAKQETLKHHVACFSRADGKLVWDRATPAKANDKPYRGFVALHGYSSGTPACDGQAIYAFFGKSGVVAYDLEGNLLWTADCGSGTHSFGSGSSPLLHEDVVIINASPESGKLLGLDKKTGKQLWAAGDQKLVWNTPALVKAEGRTEVVVSMRGKLAAYDPTTGKPLWTCRGINDYIVPSVLAHDGVVYAIGGRKNTCIAVRAGGQGDVSQSHKIWEIGKGSNVSSPVYFDGHLYWASETKGIVYCVDAKTGKVAYEKRLEPRPGRIYASPVLADGRLYYVSRNAGTFVIAAQPEFKLLAHNKIASDKSIFNASPAISEGSLLLRSDKVLYCLGAK